MHLRPAALRAPDLLAALRALDLLAVALRPLDLLAALRALHLQPVALRLVALRRVSQRLAGRQSRPSHRSRTRRQAAGLRAAAAASDQGPTGRALFRLTQQQERGGSHQAPAFF